MVDSPLNDVRVENAVDDPALRMPTQTQRLAVGRKLSWNHFVSIRVYQNRIDLRGILFLDLPQQAL
jgi:hypothetical protein